MGIKILLLEQNEEYRESFKAAIADTKYEIVQEFSCGNDLLQALDSVEFDIIVMCIVCPGYTDKPGMGGIEFLEAVLDKRPDVRIVVTNTIDTKYLIMKAVKAGAVARISKPFKRDNALGHLAQAETAELGSVAVKRGGIRLSKPLAISYKLASDGLLTGRRSAVSDDLSDTGMAMSTNEIIPEKTVMYLVIELPGGKPLKVQARVMRSKADNAAGRCDLGLQFIQLSDRDRETLKAFIIKVASKG